MNFDEALSAHVAWKGKLAAYLRHPDHSISASKLALDDGCKLGQWLHTEAQKYSALPEFRALMGHHAAFHRAAADLVRRADAGERVAEEVGLGRDSAFSKASAEVVSALNEMKRKA
jgi:methyl-accepting chemotaxis protein